MNVKDEWIDQLLLHDYASCKFLRVLTTRNRQEGLRPEQPSRAARRSPERNGQLQATEDWQQLGDAVYLLTSVGTARLADSDVADAYAVAVARDDVLAKYRATDEPSDRSESNANDAASAWANPNHGQRRQLHTGDEQLGV